MPRRCQAGSTPRPIACTPGSSAASSVARPTTTSSIRAATESPSMPYAGVVPPPRRLALPSAVAPGSSARLRRSLTRAAIAAPRVCSVAVNAAARRTCTSTSPTVISMTSSLAGLPSTDSRRASNSLPTTSGKVIGRSRTARAACT